MGNKKLWRWCSHFTELHFNMEFIGNSSHMSHPSKPKPTSSCSKPPFSGGVQIQRSTIRYFSDYWLANKYRFSLCVNAPFFYNNIETTPECLANHREYVLSDGVLEFSSIACTRFLHETLVNLHVTFLSIHTWYVYA